MSDKWFVRILIIISFMGCFCLYCLDANAQKSPQTKAKSSNNTLKKKQTSCKLQPPIISRGVLNGKALKLVVPEYPSLARAANVYGKVVVQVLIDENGYIQSVKAISGHPLLRAAAVQAALQSTFEPFTLSGCPAKVSGIITYNFLAQTWNWFEIGYTLGKNNGNGFYSFDNIKNALPFGHEEEKQLLKQAEDNYKSRSDLIKAVISLTKSKLLNDTKNTWLFSAGLAMADVSQAGFEMNQKLQNLIALIQIAPKDVSETLLSDLRKLAMFVERNPFLREEFWQAFKEIEERLPTTGR